MKSKNSDAVDLATSVTTPSPSNPKRPFYGWVIVASVFVVLSVVSGVGFYNASVILSAATNELDTSVGSVSGATGLFFAIGGLSGFVLAKPMETTDIRWFFLAGGIAGGAALYGLRWVDSVLDLYLFFALFGVGFGTAGLIPATTLVTRWFDRRRPVAISIASTGLSVGGIVLTPIAAYLITTNGLANAGTLLAVIWVLGIVPIALLFLRPFPASLGLRPDGGLQQNGSQHRDDSQCQHRDRAEKQHQHSDGNQRHRRDRQPDRTASSRKAAVERPPGATYAHARVTRFFIALCVGYLFIFFGQVGALAQLFNMVQERSDAAAAGTSLSALALASVAARLIGGALILRIDTRLFTVALAILQSMALVLLALAQTSPSLVGFAAILGVSIGNLLMLQPLLLAEAFGVAEYGRIYSSSQLIATIGVATGPLALGLVRDAVDYRLAFIVAAAASFCGAVALQAAGPSGAVQRIWQ